MVFTLATLAAVWLAQAAQPPSFEVATIKRNMSGESDGAMGFQPGGRFHAVNFDTRRMIAIAYGTGRRLQPQQVIGGPDWLSRDRYDVTAKVSQELAAGSPEQLFPQLPLFVQSLLQERFKLRVHHEMREIPVYVLEFARKDRSLGPGFARASADCGVTPEACRFRTTPGRARGGVVAMPTLTNFLAGAVDRFVVDRTGLDGTFRVELDWSPDQVGDAPSIFTAVQEQLGLRLNAGRAPVDVLVIDHVERPSED
jgi:bla regulator protein blaR1